MPRFVEYAIPEPLNDDMDRVFLCQLRFLVGRRLWNSFGQDSRPVFMMIR